MSRPLEIFDHKIRALRRARALQLGFETFLHKEVADILDERLEEVNKDFKSVGLITGFPEFWAGRYPQAQVFPDREVLELPTEYDLIIHALCAHSSNDLVGQFIQIRRALKPDGLMIVVMFGGQTLQELRASLAEAEAEIRGGLAPRIAPMGEIRDLGGLISRSGLALPVADAIGFNVTYASPLRLMHDLRAMGETNCQSAQERTFLRRDVLMRASQLYTENFSRPDGQVEATFELVFLTGWAPAASQPKPLRPGSAKTRLADALGTDENPVIEEPDKN